MTVKDSIVESDVRAAIISKLMFVPSASFSDLFDGNMESNKFAYYLKTLEDEGIIMKKDQRYVLTTEGKRFSTYLEGESGKREKQPMLGVLTIVINGDKVLLGERTKEPFYGYWAAPGGKIKFGETIIETAERELLEETGLHAKNIEIKGLACIKTYNESGLAYNHYQYIVKCTDLEGKLKVADKEGINRWIKISDLKKYKLFPDIPDFVEIALNGKHFVILDSKCFQENDVFIEKKGEQTKRTEI
jgi:8-oxo-dGTP diphosphatase